MTLTRRAYAKINLSLDIISKMDNGYHCLRTVMQTVGLCDEITVSCDDKPGAGSKEPGAGNAGGSCSITVDAGASYIPNDGRNVAVKAAEAFFKHTGISGYETEIRIKKKIPVCAGLAGGSADAACVLRMLDEMCETALGRETLEGIACTVGADVPFCINGGTKLAEGRGEVLTDLTPVPECYVVICKPPFHCPTPELFSRVNCKEIRVRPDTAGLLKAIERSDVRAAARYMYNVFEDILPRGRNDVDMIKGELLEYGAHGAVMTGSGPTVFGIFDDESCAKAAYEQLKTKYRECFLTETITPNS